MHLSIQSFAYLKKEPNECYQILFQGAIHDLFSKGTRAKSMIITKETDYAIRILRALADNEKHRLNVICEHEKIPQNFGYKIIGQLQKKGVCQNETRKKWWDVF